MKEIEIIPNERLLASAQGSIYKLTVLAAKRALQLADGDKPLVDDCISEKVLEIALKEIEHKQIRVSEK